MIKTKPAQEARAGDGSLRCCVRVRHGDRRRLLHAVLRRREKRHAAPAGPARRSTASRRRSSGRATRRRTTPRWSSRVRDAGSRNRLPRPLSRNARRSDLPPAQQLADPALRGRRPAARGDADRPGGERRPAHEFPLPAPLGQHQGGQRPGKARLPGRRFVPAYTFTGSRSFPITRRRRTGRGRAGCASWKSPISAT